MFRSILNTESFRKVRAFRVADGNKDAYGQALFMKERKAKKGTLTKVQKKQRSGTVAIMGRPNVGKSTLLNAILDHPLAIVSPVPQTTRHRMAGIFHQDLSEMILLDTPGIHQPKTSLGRYMNQQAREAARQADIRVLMVQIPMAVASSRALEPHPSDITLMADLVEPTLLVINKVDHIKDKSKLLPLMEAYHQKFNFASIVPISALQSDGVEAVVKEIQKLLPERAWQFEADDLTDKPTRFFASEYLREQILLLSRKEVPHATTVTIDRWNESNPKIVHIDATIHVERLGQKKILIGTGGAMLKQIGTNARLRMEELIGRKVHVKLFVRVTEDWRKLQATLEEFGYGNATE